ncbi:MAG: hypothetical protein F4Y57_12935, partial [Acidobacteria bacterium]|nr:hypothetical protein [Acidobacteriota bacterium]
MSNEASLLVVQGGAAGDTDGGSDNNWLSEQVRFTLSAGSGTSVSPAAYTLTVNDGDVAPVARFTAPSFTLTEGSERMLALDIQPGVRGGTIPTAGTTAGVSTNDSPVVVSVSNHQMVTIGAAGTADACPAANAGRKALHFVLDAEWGADAAAFGRTARLSTTGTTATIADLAGAADAGINVIACDVPGFRNQSVTLTILPNNLVEPPTARSRGDVTIGSALTITVDSDEAAPTLSFSPTDVTIDEGDSVSTRLIADGASATEVGMVKLMVEGDAMVDLYHEDSMLEEMDGY